MLIKNKAYHKLFKKMYKDGAFLFITAIVEFTAGLAIILHHNLWTNLPEIIISLLGWMMMLEAVLVAVNKKVYIKKMYSIMKETSVIITGLVSLLLGAYLGWVGFFA